MRLLDLLFGRPLATEEDRGERIGPLVGVAVLGLDGLASASYGPEALLTVLRPLGGAGLHHALMLTAVIVVLLGIVSMSYRQTITAYPHGGGAYTVARENLGTGASLFAAAALALDYLLNVAVAISAGVGALVSALPALLPHTLLLCLGLLLLLTLLNLRGVRATGAALVVPTFTYVACLFTVIGVGLVKTALSGGHPVPVEPPHAAPATLGAASVWLLVRAFANGCTAMTGIEAVSNAAPLFREPSVVGARRTLALITTILVVSLGGIAFLSARYGITATPPGEVGFQSILSQLVAAVAGRGPFYYATIASIIAVLALSANTSFADFPRVCRMLAADRFLPEPFLHRGRRLIFSLGIVFLAGFAAILLVVFGGITHALIPLFAIGALSAFTMSQLGMVAHWRRLRGAHAKRSLVLNAVGAAATSLTACVVLVSKFKEGAWITVFLVGAMILLFWRIRRHYELLEKATETTASLEVGALRAPVAVVPMRRWDAVAVKGLRFAVGMAHEVVVVQVLTGDHNVDDLSERWEELAVEPARRMGIEPPKLVVRQSEYRQLFSPLLEAVNDIVKQHPNRQVAVVVPELVERRWYHYFLHDQSASVLKTLLLYRGNPQIVIVNIPWYLRDWLPERRLLRRMWQRRLGRPNVSRGQRT